MAEPEVVTEEGLRTIYAAVPASALPAERWKGMRAWFRHGSYVAVGKVVWCDGTTAWVYDNDYVRRLRRAGQEPVIITGPAPRFSDREKEVVITFTTHVKVNAVVWLTADLGEPDGVSIEATLEWLDKKPREILCAMCACPYDQHSTDPQEVGSCPRLDDADERYQLTYWTPE